jgi:hypothetical protein
METSGIIDDPWAFLLGKIQSSGGLPENWRWASSHGPAEPQQIQRRNELKAASLQAGAPTRRKSLMKFTFRSVTDFQPPTYDAMQEAWAILKGQSQAESSSSYLLESKSHFSCSSYHRSMLPHTSGCVQYHGIPMLQPKLRPGIARRLVGTSPPLQRRVGLNTAQRRKQPRFLSSSFKNTAAPRDAGMIYAMERLREDASRRLEFDKIMEKDKHVLSPIHSSHGVRDQSTTVQFD